MHSFLRLIAVALFCASSVSADAVLDDPAVPDDLDPVKVVRSFRGNKTPSSRKLDAKFAKKTSPPTQGPTFEPTFSPTKRPTSAPTRHPTIAINTALPTHKAPPECGTIVFKEDHDLVINQTVTVPDQHTYHCNHWKGYYINDKKHSFPLYMHGFRLSVTCEYSYRSPATGQLWKGVRGPNELLEQALRLITQVDTAGYKVDEGILFNGEVTPNKYTDYVRDWSHPVHHKVVLECPELYCMKITGPSITDTTNSSNTDPALIWAFSDWNSYKSFHDLLWWLQGFYWKHKFWETNHYKRCGCECFCVDENQPYDSVQIRATCYMEMVCGVRTYQIAYASDYPVSERVSWEHTGTMEPMQWFNACANAMYNCSEVPGHSNITMFSGVGEVNEKGTWYKSFPRAWTYDNRYGHDWVYVLGGNHRYGFWKERTNSNSNNGKYISWHCPTREHRQALKTFGSWISRTGFMRISGEGETAPTVPCDEPEYEDREEISYPPQLGPLCENITDVGKQFCYEMTGATCYAIQNQATSCEDVEFYLNDGHNTHGYGDDINSWINSCFKKVGCDRLPSYATKDGKLTGNTYPNNSIKKESNGWSISLNNRILDHVPSIENTTETGDHSIYYLCDNLAAAYRAQNFTKNAQGNHKHWYEGKHGDGTHGNDIDLFGLNNRLCPSSAPSMVPTASIAPSDAPSQNPTFCGETYLTKTDLNIALVIDLSYSTYEKIFSSTVDVGDFNGDGKGNTVLDATIVAVEELLKAIADSPSLRNGSCEIRVISFSTGAESHGTWAPLNGDQDAPNPLLMELAKGLRTPNSTLEVQYSNNGYTNFDAALDEAVVYFQNDANTTRDNLLVFLSDGEPNVRGDGDNEGYCAPNVTFWNDEIEGRQWACSNLGLDPGESRTNCLANDANCTDNDQYQDCVRGNNHCLNHDVTVQFDSEIAALDALGVYRTAIGIGNASNVQENSGLWVIDDNPAKYKGVLPLQALDLDELSEYLSSLCILNTDPPTRSPSDSPSNTPTVSMVPSVSPSMEPSDFPSGAPSPSPTRQPSEGPTGSPSVSIEPSSSPTFTPTESFQPTGNECYRDALAAVSARRIGQMDFCVRTSLGYTHAGGFKEVNFIETLVTIRYDLTSGFCVIAFNVEPKIREGITVQEDAFGLEAYLCEPSDTEVLSNPTRTRPKRLTDYDYNETNPFSEDADAQYYNQGALITVCVAPDAPSYEEGVRMDGLDSFSWFREANITNPNADNPFAPGWPEVQQTAIDGGSQAGNMLTTYIKQQCEGGYEYCHFSSVLFADFYAIRGFVSGTGSGSLRFVPPDQAPLYPSGMLERRLESPEERAARRLQDGAGTSEFDLLVPTDITDDGPGALRTAGGPSSKIFNSVLVCSALVLLAATLWI